LELASGNDRYKPDSDRPGQSHRTPEGKTVMSTSKVSFHHTGETTIATVHAPEMNSLIGDVLLTELDEVHRSGKSGRLVVDLSEVKFVGSLGLSSLLMVRRQAGACNCRFALVGLTGHSRSVLEVTGLQRLLNLHNDLPSALRDAECVGTDGVAHPTSARCDCGPSVFVSH
jgi:anti-anti-sigma factor